MYKNLTRASLAFLCAFGLLIFTGASAQASCDLEALKPDRSINGAVEYAYCLMFDRPSDPGGKAAWTSELTRGLRSRTGLLDVFYLSGEFQTVNQVASLSNS